MHPPNGFQGRIWAVGRRGLGGMGGGRNGVLNWLSNPSGRPILDFCLILVTSLAFTVKEPLVLVFFNIVFVRYVCGFG